MKMPIAAQLMSGAQLVYMGDLLSAIERNPAPGSTIVARAVEPEVHKKVLQSVHQAVPFDVQIASELYWGNPKEYYRLDRDFGPMRLPYGAIWMEWSLPNEPYMKGKKVTDDEGKQTNFACYIYQDELDDRMPRNADIAVMAQLLAWSPNWLGEKGEQPPVALNEVAIKWGLDSQGLYVHESLSEWSPPNITEKTRAILNAEAKSNVFVACMALNLANCRNVKIAQAGVVQVRRSGREKRQGVKPVRYHTIVLPGMTVERGRVSRNQAKANADALALHMVRGHFKTFSSDKPLLGKHVGTYWWNPAVRGNADKGKIVSDYKIGEQP